MRDFELQLTLAENIVELRRALGSAARSLSRDDLAAMVSARHPEKRRVNESTVKRWENEGNPDPQSLRILARLAGVTIEEFIGATEGEPDATIPPTQPKAEGA